MSLRRRLLAVLLASVALYAAAIILLARSLQPSTSLLADLDLISAESRAHVAFREWHRKHVDLSGAPPASLVSALRAVAVPPGVSGWVGDVPLWKGLQPERQAEHRQSLLEDTNWSLRLSESSPPGLMIMPRRGHRATGLMRLFVLLAVVVGATRALSHQLRSALERFPQAVKRLAEGELDLRLPPSDDPQLQSHIVELNRLAERLQNADTELRESVAELECRRESKSRLLALVSHELRTPLTALLSEERRFAPEHRALLQQSCERLVKRLERLLEWARLDSGQLQPSFQEFELSEVLEVAVEATGLQVEVDLWREPLLIRSDFAWLARALESLVAAAGPGARVSTGLDGPRPCLELPAGRRISREQIKIPARLTFEECRQVLGALGIELEERASLRLRFPR
jgi:signal transduction histidine kinase